MSNWAERMAKRHKARIRLFLWLVYFSIAPASAFANPALESILEKGAVGETWLQLEQAYASNLARQSRGYGLSDGQKTVLNTTLSVYNSDAIKAELLEVLAESWTAQRAQSVLKVMDSDISKSLQRFERMLQSNKSEQLLRSYYKQRPPSPERLELLRKTHTISQAHSLAALLQSFAEVDTAVALDLVSGENISRFDALGVQLWRSNIEEAYAQRYAVEADAYLNYAFRLLRDDKLRLFIDSWSEPEVQSYLRDVQNALRQTLTEKRTIIYQIQPPDAGGR